MPDVIQMVKKIRKLILLQEMFLYILEQLENYFVEINLCQKRKENLNTEKDIETDQIKKDVQLCDALKKRELEKQFQKLLDELQKKLDKENSKIILLKKCILELTNIALTIDIIYNYQKELYQVEDSDMAHKKFLPREKYFTQFSPPKTQKIYPPEQLRLELNPKIREFQNETINKFQKQNKLLYAENLEKDSVARHWRNKEPQLLQLKQKEQIEEKKGIIVEKIESKGDKLVNEAMEREIQRIRNMQKQKKEMQETTKTFK